MTTKPHPVSFRLPPEKKQALEQAVRDDLRSVTAQLEMIITEWLKKRGYLKASRDR